MNPYLPETRERERERASERERGSEGRGHGLHFGITAEGEGRIENFRRHFFAGQLRYGEKGPYRWLYGWVQQI